MILHKSSELTSKNFILNLSIELKQDTTIEVVVHYSERLIDNQIQNIATSFEISKIEYPENGGITEDDCAASWHYELFDLKDDLTEFFKEYLKLSENETDKFIETIKKDCFECGVDLSPWERV